MSKEFSRSERISESIQKSLSQLIGENIRDPRVGMVSINHVAVTKDYSIARVYVSFVDARGEENAKLGVEALNGACLLYTSQSPRDQRGSRKAS